eukprot:2453409-Amphidinium_carterae.1
MDQLFDAYFIIFAFRSTHEDPVKLLGREESITFVAGSLYLNKLTNKTQDEQTICLLGAFAKFGHWSLCFSTECCSMAAESSGSVAVRR